MCSRQKLIERPTTRVSMPSARASPAVASAYGPAPITSSSVAVTRRDRTPRDSSAHDEHVARRVAHDAVRDRPLDEARDRAAAALAHDDEVGAALLRRGDDLRRGV